MKFLFGVAVPAIAGAVVATGVIYGLIQAQTSPPETNPASEPVITYGER